MESEKTVTIKSVNDKIENAVSEVRDLFVKELDCYDHDVLAREILKDNTSRLKKLAKTLVKIRQLQDDFRFTFK